MSKRVYFEHKKYAEDTRRMLEENTGVPTELHKNHKGWFCKVKNDYRYTTADGFTTETGTTVYDAVNNPYEVRRVLYAEDQVWVQVVPRDVGEPSKDKDIREGIIWVVEKLPQVIVEMKRRDISKFTCAESQLKQRLRNAVDERRNFASGDYILSLKTRNLWKIDAKRGKFIISESDTDVIELDKTLQSVAIVDGEARVVDDLAMIIGSGDNCFVDIGLFYAAVRDAGRVKMHTVVEAVCKLSKNQWLLAAFWITFVISTVTCLILTTIGSGGTVVGTIGFVSLILVLLLGYAIDNSA